MLVARRTIIGVMDAHIMDLRCFLAAVEESSITRAGERLSISQPAATKHLLSLEHALGVKLFSRADPKVTITLPGVALRPHAEEVLLAWDRAQRAVEESKRS